jgi:hypothetical protein
MEIISSWIEFKTYKTLDEASEETEKWIENYLRTA